jgi:hypothetical protein
MKSRKAGGKLNPKYPGGVPQQKERLEAEGHQVVQKGKRFVVAGFEKALMRERDLRRRTKNNC